MIKNIIVDDITSPDNDADIIIGMNSTLTDVRGIGLPFVAKVSVIHPIILGSVLSFRFNEKQDLHMLICHDLGRGGWEDAPRHVRFGLDYLSHTTKGRKFSVVQIGTGRVGRRDGADTGKILTAIANSFLSVDLYVYETRSREFNISMRKLVQLQAYRAWHPTLGEEQVAA